ncbi:MAG TPA: hypothetical protein P5179_04760 [Candidatus Latescibacteria bacterium]|nr:hypothetical protein [Candidatus Latescibacterota bacterium]
MTARVRQTSRFAFRVGASEQDITPPYGAYLSGSACGDRRPAQSVLDRTYARAIVFDDGRARVCVISLDVTIITGEYSTRIRNDVSDATGIPIEAIMVFAEQTHSAPSVGRFMLDPDFPLETTPETEYLWGSETPYCEFASKKAVQAAIEAHDRLQPARVGLARALNAEFSFNRRGVTRDGRIIMPKPAGRENQPFGITELCYMEGPMDPEVGVACFQGLDMRPIAFLLHHTCHPVNVFGSRGTYRAVSSDWPGAWAEGMKRAYGSHVVPLVLNGCCGNINPWNPFEPDARPDHRRMGKALAEVSEKLVHTMQFAEGAQVASCADCVSLPFREIPGERRRMVAEILERSPEPPRSANGEVDPVWFTAASTRSVEILKQRETHMRYEMQVFRVGDLAIVGLPGEPFVEGQLAIKTSSPVPFTFPTHMVSHYVGYLPTREAYARGGHEANNEVTYWAKLALGCLETVAERAVVNIKTLFPDRVA